MMNVILEDRIIMTTDIKPYRITRKYYNNNVSKTYTHDYTTFDKATAAIFKMLDDPETTSYTFDLHKLVITKTDGSKVVAELRNTIKPCILPLYDVFDSWQVDRKCQYHLDI